MGNYSDLLLVITTGKKESLRRSKVKVTKSITVVTDNEQNLGLSKVV